MAVTGPVDRGHAGRGVAHPRPARARRAAPGRGGRAATARCWPSTPARRSPPAASACARCSSSWPPTARRARASCAPRPRSSSSTRRPSSTTTCSTPPLCAAGVPTVVAVGGRGAATATGDLLFARAFAELAANGRADEIRVLSEASLGAGRGRAAAARRRLERRACRSSATCAAASSRPRACSRPRAGSGALEGAGAARRARRLRAAHRPGLPAARRRARRLRPGRSAPASSAGPTCSTAR